MGVGVRRRAPSRIPDQLGARVRKARLELGLSLSAVAGKDFSRAFLNQVELGRSRPSTRNLQIIAERLHRPIEYFLQDPEESTTLVELVLAQARTRLQRGDAVQARAQLTELTARRRLAPELRAQAQLLLGEAYLRLGAIEDAVALLRTAIGTSEAAGWTGLVVELYDRMGSAYYLKRQRHEAGRWWDKALNLYEDAELSDPLLRARILGHRANLHYLAGEPEEAIAAYQAAIAGAGQVLDMQALGGIYEGLAVAFQRTGQHGRALEYAQRSLRLFETLHDVRMSARLRSNMARILLEQGRTEEAEQLYLEGASQLRQVRETDLLPLVLAGAAEAALNRGAPATAEARLAEAAAALPGSGDALALLAVKRVGARIAQARGRTAEARAIFDEALQIAAGVDSRLEWSRVAYEYAQVLESQGDSAAAIARYRDAYQAQLAAGVPVVKQAAKS